MELTLVSVKDKQTNKVKYFAVNEQHYDAMLASGGSDLDLHYEWHLLGDVEISEEILNEQGWFN